MSEHDQQTEFFKAMCRRGDTMEHRHLSERIRQAQRDERCVRRAIAKILVLTALSVLGALYTVVFMPEVLLGAGAGIKKVFLALLIGCLLTSAAYLGSWFYYRALLFQAHKECRQFFLSVFKGMDFSLEAYEDSDGNAEMVLTERRT